MSLKISTGDESARAVKAAIETGRGPHPVGYAPRSGYAAYARILHPVPRGVGATIPDVTWAEVAEITGRAISPRTQWRELIAGAEDDLAERAFAFWESGPFDCGLPEQQCRALIELLDGFDGGDYTFGVWAGFGDLQPSIARAEANVDVAARETILLSGRLADAASNVASAPTGLQIFRSMNIWLPSTSEWLVTSDIYSTSSLVAGPAELIYAVAGDSRLEVLRIDAADVEAVLVS